MTSDDDQEAIPWHLGVFDAHCHPTDTLSSLQSIPSMRAKVLTIMATRAQDQELVAKAADVFGLTQSEAEDLTIDWSQVHRVIPAFGWHPWFSHQMFDEDEYDGATFLTSDQKAKHYRTALVPKPADDPFLNSLPDPRPLGKFLDQTRNCLEKYPLAMIGEVGLDKQFRIPEAWLPEWTEGRDDSLTPGGREGRRLSPYRVDMEHQKKVLLAQLRLAGELERAVSCHGVQAHGIVYETLASTWEGHERKVLSKKAKKKAIANGEPDDHNETAAIGPKPYPPRLCLHSFSGPAETVKQYISPSVPCEIFFSFSTTINSWSEDGKGKVEAAVRAIPDDRVLIESDLHTAGEKMDQHLADIVRKICEVKCWSLDDGVKQLGRNWRRFVFGRQ